MYDYQNHFHDPDAYDPLLRQWRELTGDKPFLSTELSVNYSRYQIPTYRVALAMAQLYHKNLTITSASAIFYCWTLLNVEQPSYGWTRTLFVPDPAHGFVPQASSHQARVFGAYSRRVKEGMERVAAVSSDKNLLATAFAGKQGQTVILLNRSINPLDVRVHWDGADFRDIEVVSPYQENARHTVPRPPIRVEPGAIVTLTSVELGKLPVN
ncbi:MAG: hypothetical protein GY953_27420 [bacterium]|nr:hypothetical protein [bacterium]